eukprot:3038914-Pyramimonas_sp.AAC.1
MVNGFHVGLRFFLITCDVETNASRCEFALFNGKLTLFGGEFALFSGKLTLFGGEFTLFSGGLTLFGGEFALFSGELTIFGGEFALFSGGLTLFCGEFTTVLGELMVPKTGRAPTRDCKTTPYGRNERFSGGALNIHCGALNIRPRHFSGAEKLEGELNSPVANGLLKGSTAVSSPIRGETAVERIRMGSGWIHMGLGGFTW